MIPTVCHFIWVGEELQFYQLLALRSAALCGGFDRLILHHTDPLSEHPLWRHIQRIERLETRRLVVADTLSRIPERGAALLELYERLTQPAAKVNLLRAALLAVEGGVYLDFDTVTVRSLTDFCAESRVFCGQERLAFPRAVVRSKNPAVWARAYLRTGARELTRQLPAGWRWFRKIERFYPCAVNNAVLAAECGHPFMLELLERMLALPEGEQSRRYALGTHLLQRAVAEYRGSDLTVHEPEVFYPLPPEVSEHWFRPTQHICLEQMLTPKTRVVHWYASTRTLRRAVLLDASTLTKTPAESPFCALAAPFVV